MANCPKCSAEILDDFGLVFCGNCGASLFVEFDGSIKENSADENMSERPIGSDYENDGELQYGPAGDQDLQYTDELDNDLSEHTVEIKELQQQDDNLEDEVDVMGVTAQHFVEPRPENAVTGTNIKVDEEALAYVNNTEPLESGDLFEPSATGDFLPQDTAIVDPMSTTDQTMQEVEHFGNSPISSAEEGIYFYTLRIDGIDSSEIKNHIYHVLRNPRLKMDADEIISTLKNGHLTIRQLSPVKAFVIVKDIMGLPIELYWEQHDITS